MQTTTTPQTLLVTDHHLGRFNMASGSEIDINNPTEESINIHDISSTLSLICRFGGHTNLFYSVAQHSMVVSALVPAELRKQALLHDAAEAYLGDVIKPIKVILGAAFANLETRFDDVIAQKFGLEWNAGIRSLIKRADTQALEMEYQALFQRNPRNLVACLNEAGFAADDTWAWGHQLANRLFLVRYVELFDENQAPLFANKAGNLALK